MCMVVLLAVYLTASVHSVITMAVVCVLVWRSRWQLQGHSVLECLYPTHTHTHCTAWLVADVGGW